MPNNFQIPPCMMKFWVGNDSGTHKRTHIQTQTYKNGQDNSICPVAILWWNLFCASRLIILYICTKCCQSISKGFTVTELNSRVDATVVADVDGRTNEWIENRIPILQHAWSMPDNEVMNWTQTGFTEAFAQTVRADYDLEFDLATWFLHMTHCLGVVIMCAK